MNIKAIGSVSVQRVIRLSVIILGVTILSGCVYYNANWGPLDLIVAEPKLKFNVEPDYNVSLKALPGELVIKGTNNDYVEASMEVKCPDNSGSCTDHFAGLDFITKGEVNNITISTNKKALLRGNITVKTTLAIPRLKRLEVNMKAGNTNIYGINVTRLDVGVYAGEVNIILPENIVAEVDLDAGMGDVSIQRQGRYEAAQRSFLVGAEVKKSISNKGATVNADVQFGNIRLNLTQ
jgi:hypothetical protein